MSKLDLRLMRWHKPDGQPSAQLQTSTDGSYWVTYRGAIAPFHHYQQLLLDGWKLIT